MTVKPSAARANGKVNLHLGVGEARSDGYHELSTVFMAVDRQEIVAVSYTHLTLPTTPYV